MMKLGWLSRLGIVLSAFAFPIIAFALATKVNSDIEASRKAAFDLCMKFAEDDPVPEMAKAIDECWDNRLADFGRGQIWRDSFGASALILAAAWILALAIYWAAQWVLAGRRSV